MKKKRIKKRALKKGTQKQRGEGDCQSVPHALSPSKKEGGGGGGGGLPGGAPRAPPLD
jgi:hypothetical protein